MTASAVLEDMVLANTRLLEALVANDPAGIDRAVMDMRAMIEDARELARVSPLHEDHDVLNGLTQSLGAAARFVETMTAALRRKRTIMALPMSYPVSRHRTA